MIFIRSFCSIHVASLLASYIGVFILMSKVKTYVEIAENPVMSYSRALPFKDWFNSELTSSVAVFEGDSCPDSHPELLFYKPFYGLSTGCYCYEEW